MEYIAKVIPQNVRTLQEEYGEDFPEAISKQHKTDIFGPMIEGITALFRQNSLAMPRDVARRIFVFNHNVYQDFAASVLKRVNPNAEAVTDTRTRLVFLDKDASERLADDLEVDLTLLLRASAAHELAGHSLIYQEIWLPKEAKDIKDVPIDEIRFKRRGPITESPTANSYRYQEGAHYLEEGIADYTRRESLKLAGLPDIQLAYPWEVELLGILAERLQGNNLLLRAIYTKQGLKPLTARMDALYGDNSIQAILEEMGYDQDVAWINSGYENDPKHLYESTKRLLRS